MLAVHTWGLEPLPHHQVQAVYGELLDRTPLRLLLADDRGAGNGRPASRQRPLGRLDAANGMPSPPAAAVRAPACSGVTPFCVACE